MVKHVPNIIFRLLDLGLERIIAEVIDNSLDKNADDIRVNFVIPNADSKKTMTVITDNGDGFESLDHLFSCMEIEADEDVLRGQEDIGKYHIGLKIAPLTKYSRVDIVTKIDSEIISLTFHEPLSSGLDYNMNDPSHQNPTYPAPIGTVSSIPSQILDFIDRSDSEWTTMVFLSNPYRKLLEESFPEDKNLRDKDYFQQNLRIFLGITYERYFRRNPSLVMKVDGKMVAASDPFWKTFTPSNIHSHIGGDSSDRATKLRRMSRFGTLEGYRFVSTVVPSLIVQPFVIPDELARKHFKSILPNGFRNDISPTPSTKPKNGGSFLESNELAGFYFYRDQRLVAYGSFYELGITDHAANNIRIEVSYKSEFGDGHFTVSPNKTRVDNISKEAYSEIYRALKVECGGDSYAEPFKLSTPFFDPQNTSRPSVVRGGRAFVASTHSHYSNTLARGSKKYIQYRECDDGGCGLIHAPGEVCPEAPSNDDDGSTDDSDTIDVPTLPRLPPGETPTERHVSKMTENSQRVNLRLFRNDRERVIEVIKKALLELEISIDDLR